MKLSNLQELGFTQYEAACYMALVKSHPVNGSQLSKASGIARSRIYDVLRNMMAKGYVMEAEAGLYVPLPPDELISRLKAGFSTHLKAFEKEIDKASLKNTYEFIWTLTGYDTVMEKAVQMIKAAKQEIYARIFPKTADRLIDHLKEAENRNVNIRIIAMGQMPVTFDVQVVHPDTGTLENTIGGRSFDIIVDRRESLVGIFEMGNEDRSPISWTRNKWFVTANRDSLRHDFYHCFLEKIYDRQLSLSQHEKHIYELIKNDQ